MRYFFCVIFAFSFSQKLSKFVVFTSNHFSKFFLFFLDGFWAKITNLSLARPNYVQRLKGVSVHYACSPHCAYGGHLLPHLWVCRTWKSSNHSRMIFEWTQTRRTFRTRMILRRLFGKVGSHASLWEWLSCDPENTRN